MNTATTMAFPETAATPAAAPFHCDVIRGAAEIGALRGAWLALAENAARPRFFHRPEWFESYLSGFAGLDDEPLLVRISREAAVVGVIPLVATRREAGGMNLRSLELPSNPHMLLCDAVVAREIEAADYIRVAIDYLRRSPPIPWDVLYLPNLLDDACIRRSLEAAAPSMMILREQCRCDSLPSSYEALAAGFSKNFRGNLRKARNKLNALAGVETRCVREPAGLAAALATFLDLEASGWKGADGTNSAIKLDDGTRRFYESLAESFGRAGLCEINLLSVEGRPIAGQFCLVAGDTSHILKIAYDESFAHCAPGNMLLERAIQRYEQEGRIRTVNLVTDAEWHANWKPQSLGVSDAWIFNKSLRGVAAYSACQARAAAGAWYRKYVAPRPEEQATDTAEKAPPETPLPR